MEDYKYFPSVSVMQDGVTKHINTAYDAAIYTLEQWPIDKGPKLYICKGILLKCLAGECSPAVARVAFVEAAREAGIFVEDKPMPAGNGKLQRWGKRQYTLARDRRPRQS